MRTARFCCFRGIGYTPAKTYQPPHTRYPTPRYPTPRDTLLPNSLPLDTLPLPCEQAHASENITFPQIRWWEVKISVDY